MKPIIAVNFRLFFGSTPSLMISDPELMKNIMVKDFSKAPNRFVCRKHLHMFLKFLEKKYLNKVNITPKFFFHKDVDAVHVLTFEGTNRTARRVEILVNRCCR